MAKELILWRVELNQNVYYYESKNTRGQIETNRGRLKRVKEGQRL
jgi:hypothetical protein